MREDLLLATRQLLLERGYESTSPREIQRRAGAGQGSFYHHFDGKLDLASQALAIGCEEMIAAFDELVKRAGDDPLRAIESFLDDERAALDGCPMGRHAMESSISLVEIRRSVVTYFEHLTAQLESLLARSVAVGRLPASLPVEELADTMVATLQGGYVLARVHRDPGRLRSALSGLRWLIGQLATAPASVRTDRPRARRRQDFPWLASGPRR